MPIFLVAFTTKILYSSVFIGAGGGTVSLLLFLLYLGFARISSRFSIAEAVADIQRDDKGIHPPIAVGHRPKPSMSISLNVLFDIRFVGSPNMSVAEHLLLKNILFTPGLTH
ncbi:hypothetical protein [Porphyromonas gingivalis]|uniref:hypothetical protein n=1 Tax=Porphyromonas gingivalis TaxID=837 RepID=UPI00097508D5|nr:hypothetical protein [Porphyromonas gingivalis]SJL21915.1 hypothetical protein PGIN_3A1_01382 [Porphyromonas gingivalis]